MELRCRSNIESVTNPSARGAPKSRPSAAGRRWAPRIWLGSSLRSWFRLLSRNSFAVSWKCLHIAAVDSVVSPINSLLGLLENALYGAAVRRRRVVRPPLFILGHWRSGTTLLHEMLCLDRGHAGPNAYECLAPHHFVLTERLLPRLLPFLAPERRPMDDMPFGFHLPFEDEFALCLLGVRSPYERIAFPNRGAMQPEMFDPEDFSPAEREQWRAALLRFMGKLTFLRPEARLVLKSPPHTCRIRTLLELFPDALFVHIVRNPYDVFPSTIHMWRTLYRRHGLQPPDCNGLEEMVLTLYSHLHACVERDRTLISKGRFHELRYEDLVAAPVETLRTVYEELRLGNADAVRPEIERYFAVRSAYRTNRWDMTDRERQRVRERWGDVIREYGY